MSTHTIEFTRDDGTDVDVEFTLTGGSPGCGPSLSYPGDPPEPPELEITSIVADLVAVELSDVEGQRLEKEIWDRIDEFEQDDDDYYDDRD